MDALGPARMPAMLDPKAGAHLEVGMVLPGIDLLNATRMAGGDLIQRDGDFALADATNGADASASRVDDIAGAGRQGGENWNWRGEVDPA